MRMTGGISIERLGRQDGGGPTMKLYWRYKKDGKWTWKIAQVCEEYGMEQPGLVVVWEEEE
jgi:hypothetical protein